MSKQKDMFEFFRENQQQFDERPSPKIWRRLETRLDHHQKRNRLSLYRSLAMVAAVLALVVMIALISILVDQKQQEYLSDQPHPLQLENLPVNENDVTAYQVVEFSRNYRDRMTKPIDEGEVTKKLIPVERKD